MFKLENGFKFSPSKTVCFHFHNRSSILVLPEPDLYLNGNSPREDAGGLSREYVLRIPSVT